MSNLPQISEAEWRVMEALWSAHPVEAVEANEVIARLAPQTGWNPKTIRTLLTRLVNKGAAGVDKNGQLYRYYPLVRQEECARAESRSFLKRVYGGSLKLMLAHYLEEEPLNSEQIAELKRILEEAKEDAKDDTEVDNR